MDVTYPLKIFSQDPLLAGVPISILLTGMDVTCGISFNPASSTMLQFEEALLAENYENIEKYSKKMRKKREVSEAFEKVMDMYIVIHRSIRLHAATFELDLSHLIAYQIPADTSKRIRDTLKKVVMDCQSSDIELKLAYVLLGIVNLFSFESNSLLEALSYFDKVDFDLSKKFLLYEVAETEIMQSSTIEKVFGLLGLYFRGLALEEHGRKEDACDQYQIVNDFLFRFRQPQFTMARAARDFLCGSLYRGALLLQQLGHPCDSASLYRSFLAFHQVTPQQKQPVNSTVRLIRAMSSYCDLLERHFRRTNYKNLCDDGQAQVSGRDLAQIWQPESVREDLILCSMLLEVIERSPLVLKQLDGLNLDNMLLRRFARIGYLEGIVRVQKTRFQNSVSDLSIYRTLFLSLYASGRFEQAALAARMYLQGHGEDIFTLLNIAQFYLNLPSKVHEAFHILDVLLDCEKMEVTMQVPYFLLRSQYLLLTKRIPAARQELQLVLQLDESNPKAHFLLAKCAAIEGNISEAETAVKKSLSVDSSCIEAWCLFALLKSAKRDFEGCLTVCNSELSNQINRDVKLSLIKVSCLSALNRSDEAIEVLKRTLSAHFKQSSDVRLDGGMTIVSEGTFGPGSFLSKFLGNDQGSFYELEAAFLNEGTKQTSFAELTAAFPASIPEYLARKANDGVDIPADILTSEDLQSLAKLRSATGSLAASQFSSLLWLEVAQIYLQEGLFTDAEAACSQSLKSNEIYAPAMGIFGKIEEARGNREAALSFYRRGLVIEPKNEICLLGAGRLLVDSAEGEMFLRRLVEIDDSCAEAWSLLAGRCARTGRESEAEAAFDRALNLEVNQPLRSYRII